MLTLKNKTKHPADKKPSEQQAEINHERHRVKDQHILGEDGIREELEIDKLPAADKPTTVQSTRKRRHISEEAAVPFQLAQPGELATPVYPYFSRPIIQLAEEHDSSSPSNENPGEDTSLPHKIALLIIS
jgi:hypothetical protein